MFAQKNRLLFVLIVIIILPALLTSAAGAENIQANENDEEITIAYVPRSLDNPIFLDAFEHAQEKAIDLGINIEWVAPFVYNEEAQIKIIESLIARKVDGMVVSVNNTPEYIDVINRAIEAGIAVATFDADAPDSRRLFHIGINNYEAGKVTAEGLLTVLENRNIDYNQQEKKLDTMIMTGVRGALNLDSRIEGFLDTVEATNIRVQDIVENQDSVNLSVELLEQYLQQNPEIDIIFFVGGWPFYVPAEALPNFQQWSKNGGVAVGIDIFYDALLLQERGLLQYLVGQDMATMGSKGLSTLYNYIKYGAEPREYIETGVEVADDDNLERLLQTHRPWRVK
ncbi:monosaccharide ABC transporter substrate-binding protein (CUT2 family) [Halanaerobium saccharolyticum]|uniref:Monosaccharide ABC transporter substrate-binding protein (CUT2 family) n=1 Tax=Halanaerobium saccharolyticum TaxID=43595 RepID=A0A2T5RKK5_9FIRM|nr:substrate-binding domain-containing protein [Halanaerobium saccharolyticum]PTV99534.1 monosaccharide ABC transporter substrate-binding protein (CUT2 family) [Halanaerobium saccharolyticum]